MIFFLLVQWIFATMMRALRTNSGEKLYPCLKCGEQKPAAGFHRHGQAYPSRDGLRPECKRCWSVKARAYRERKLVEDPQEFNRRRVEINRKYKFGIDQAQYDAMLEAQGGVCAICGSDDPRNSQHQQFSIDHDHETGAIRGLLCDPCNNGLGRFGDDPVRLLKAASYLMREEATCSV